MQVVGEMGRGEDEDIVAPSDGNERYLFRYTGMHLSAQRSSD